MRGFRIAWIVACALAGLFLIACAPPVLVDSGTGSIDTEAPPALPEPAGVEKQVPSAAPITSTEYTLSLTAVQGDGTTGIEVSDRRIFPLSEITYTVSADSLVDLPVSGVPVLALGRIISGTATAITNTETVTWLLFSAVDMPRWDTEWRQMRTDTVAGQIREMSVMHAIAGDNVIVFPCCGDGEEAALALLQARNSWADDHGVQVWLEHVMIRHTDADGKETWSLWSFHNDPGGGAGPNGKKTFCNLYLRCPTALDPWATWVCSWYCK